MPREGRPFWWPRCIHCSRWLPWDRAALIALLDDPYVCKRCAIAIHATTPEETINA